MACSPGPQSGRETIDIDLGEPAAVSGVSIALGGDNVEGYPRLLDVEVSPNGTDWRRVWRGPTGALALAGALSNPKLTPVDVAFSAPGTRFLRLQQIAVGIRWAWCVTGVAVFGEEPGAQ